MRPTVSSKSLVAIGVPHMMRGAAAVGKGKSEGIKDFPASTQCDGHLHHVFKLTHVAGPGAVLQTLKSSRAIGERSGDVFLPANLFDKVMGQDRDVFQPVREAAGPGSVRRSDDSTDLQRNFPSRIFWSRSTLVAAISRTSTRTVSELPTR